MQYKLQLKQIRRTNSSPINGLNPYNYWEWEINRDRENQLGKIWKKIREDIKEKKHE